MMGISHVSFTAENRGTMTAEMLELEHGTDSAKIRVKGGEP